MSEGKWCYSFNGENFNGEFDTKEDAIAEAVSLVDEEDGDQTHVWTGKMKDVVCRVDTDRVLDNLRDEALDSHGEYAESFLDEVSTVAFDILDNRLNKVLSEWMKEFNHSPKFYEVTNVEEIEVINFLIAKVIHKL